MNDRRLFLAFFPQPGILKDLQAVREFLTLENRWPQARWESLEMLHITLHFLGLADPEQAVRAAERAVVGLSIGPILLNRWICFPYPSSARILGLGPAAAPADLALLHRRLGEGLRDEGLEVETRPYVPHLTLARVRPEADFTTLPLAPEIALLSGELVLVESARGEGRNGPVYKRIREFTLAS